MRMSDFQTPTKIKFNTEMLCKNWVVFCSVNKTKTDFFQLIILKIGFLKKIKRLIGIIFIYDLLWDYLFATLLSAIK